MCLTINKIKCKAFRYYIIYCIDLVPTTNKSATTKVSYTHK